MNEGRKLVFHIGAYSPETIPMATLAEYMTDLAALLGKEHGVHFAGLEEGSTNLAAIVDFEDVPKVTTRLNDIRRCDPTRDLTRLFRQIDQRLANDNAMGRILISNDDGSSATEVLSFPGRERPSAASYGPFVQGGTLDGVLISIGGRNEKVPLRL